MKYCPKCGQMLTDSAAACSACGTPVQHPDYPVIKENPGLGIAALVLSIIGFITGFFLIGYLLDVIAIVLAVVVFVRARHKSIKPGCATAAVIVSVISLLPFVVPIIFSRP